MNSDIRISRYFLVDSVLSHNKLRGRFLDFHFTDEETKAPLRGDVLKVT